MIPKIRHCSGCVVYREDDSKNLEFLLITSGNRERWVFPKGGIESGLTAVENALKETAEEAGVKVYAHTYLGEYTYFKKSVFVINKTQVFLGQFENYIDWEEENKRDRAWFPLDEALNNIDPYIAPFLVEAYKKLRKS